MASPKKIPAPGNFHNGRRRFLSLGLKFSALGVLLFPLQKALGNGSSYLVSNAAKLGQRIRKMILSDQLILNTKSKIVHLPTGKVFKRYQDIRAEHQQTLDLKNWESQVHGPVRFTKERSGIILEMLALQKLSGGINDKNLNAAIDTLSIAFSPVYLDSKGEFVNKYNFRLHELLVKLITLNNSIPFPKKWARFHLAKGKIDYMIDDNSSQQKSIPPRVNWIKNSDAFEEKVIFLERNKTALENRIKLRVQDHKLS